MEYLVENERDLLNLSLLDQGEYILTLSGMMNLLSIFLCQPVDILYKNQYYCFIPYIWVHDM